MLNLRILFRFSLNSSLTNIEAFWMNLFLGPIAPQCQCMSSKNIMFLFGQKVKVGKAVTVNAKEKTFQSLPFPITITLLRTQRIIIMTTNSLSSKGKSRRGRS